MINPVSPSPATVKTKALRGGVAKVCSQAATFAVRVGSLMVFARLLEPNDFGIVGMVLALTGVLSLFKDFGLSAATIQHASISDDQKSNLFWLNLAVGFALGLILLVAAPMLVKFYREPRVLWVAVALAAGFPIGAASAQHYALLEREMRFVPVAMIEVGALMFSTAFGIAMAWSGYGYWALVGASLSATTVQSVAVWFVTKWIPRLPSKGAGIRAMVRFGGTISLNGLVVYVAYNIEKVLLGRVWGAAALGLYGRAYQLVNIPTENINSSIGGVAFSALSRLQEEPQRLKTYFLKGYALVLSVTVPITVACALLGHDLISVLLGPKWQDAVPVFRLLAPTILVFAIINPFSWLLMSLGLVKRSLRIALVIAPLVITADLIGLSYGPTGVALAYSTAMTCWVVPHVVWCVHGTMLTVRDIAVVVVRPIVAAAVAAVVAFGVTTVLGPAAAPALRLIAGGAALVVCYGFLLLVVMKQSAFYFSIVRTLRTGAVGSGAEAAAF